MDCNGLYRFRLRFNSDCHGKGPANEPCLHVFFFSKSKQIMSKYLLYLMGVKEIYFPHHTRSFAKMLRLEAAVREISYFLEADGSGHAPAKCPGEPRTVEGFMMFCVCLQRCSTGPTLASHIAQTGTA